jgi:uncharacterized protein (DUF1501 family)
MQTRRIFLKNSALAMVGTGSAPLWLERALYAQQGARKKILVAVFQRGAADGLNMVVPFNERRYYDLRPSIAIPKPGQANGAIDLDGSFGLHPSLAALKPLYDAKALAIVHAAGSPDPTRSHFDAQDFMESGAPGNKGARDGWMNRALAPGERTSPVRALALGKILPRSLRGRHAAVAIDSIADFHVTDAKAAAMFETMYREAPDTVLRGAARDTFSAVSLLQSIQKQPYSPAGGAEYPGSRFGESLKQIAQLIKAGAGVEMAFADVGGWDHHVNEAPQLTNMLRDFGGSLAAFARDLGDRMSDVALVTMSEFGRTAHENGNRGTDHGHANCMFVLGGGVKGGAVYGEWPGLEREQLYEGRDLAVTTDFRDVLGEIVAVHLGNANLSTVFPGYTPAKRRGFLQT